MPPVGMDAEKCRARKALSHNNFQLFPFPRGQLSNIQACAKKTGANLSLKTKHYHLATSTREIVA